MAFELPVIIVLLGYLGLIDAATLKKNRKNAILGITVMAALFAPPDAISMLLLGVPLVLMYEGAIWVVQWLGVRRRRQAAEEAAAENYDPFRGQSKP
jgi:sec-independent protein translocase protein TatC